MKLDTNCRAGIGSVPLGWRLKSTPQQFLPDHAPYNSRALASAGEGLSRCRLSLPRQEGSNRSYVKPGILRPVVIPTYKEVPVSIIRSNLKTAGISRDQDFDLLKEGDQIGTIPVPSPLFAGSSSSLASPRPEHVTPRKRARLGRRGDPPASSPGLPAKAQEPAAIVRWRPQSTVQSFGPTAYCVQ